VEFTKREKLKIEKEAIKAINRYYNIDNHAVIVSCRMCEIANCSCNDCPFYSVSKKLDCGDMEIGGDKIGNESRLGLKKSDKAAWQKEIKDRYNDWAKRNDTDQLVWVKGE